MGVICEHVRGLVDALNEIAVDVEKVEAQDLSAEERASMINATARIYLAVMNKKEQFEALEEYRQRCGL